ncbi:N-terminal asparagine amidohydrolase-like protein [Mytilinidion resinicola]|uniref:N-terminal asparagine amidohydrolase-like protein n=1 Tax=Mytilinidion resinicola TaxID=574789 RepID=A0A6A6YQH0_9PEZI|nr:N-terminal asparagine amidohydrolase-like protein [Mytilinidion resinicola]KAF2811011.1 N-terminal asparagine amidohydrolase-like protein [Mytilinidion resinicola]
MKIACLQFSAELGLVEKNMRRADEILSHTNIPSNLDWLILPECAFTGYNFPSLDHIRPYLEPTAAGPTAQWAIRTAQRLHCHVTVGYPERSSEPFSSPSPRPHEFRNYNATLTVSPSGTVLLNYRKTFLYYTDETWSLPGSAFYSGSLGNLGGVTHGICMDINPHKFLAPFTAYEFSNAALAARSPLICVSMAWISALEPDELDAEGTAREPDFATLSYWVQRFVPVVDRCKESGAAVTIVLANRCGRERETGYAGSSCVLRVDGEGVKMYEALGRAEERCLVVDTNMRPKFQLATNI